MSGNHGQHGSNHARRQEDKKKLVYVLAITCSFMFVEVIVGFSTNSLALLADAGHMLSDVAAIVLSLIAIWFASKSANSRKSFGYFRSEILASLFNALALLAISGFVLYEAVQRLWGAPAVDSGPMLLVAVVGLVINLISAKLLHSSSKDSLNVKGAYLEVLGDALGSIGVIAAALIIRYTGWNIADPIISGIIALLIIPRTWSLLSQCIHILMEGVPAHIELAAVRKTVLEVEGVSDLHDLHVWTLTAGMDSLSAHVQVKERHDPQTVLTNVKEVLEHDFGIHHTTIQVEVEKLDCAEPGGCK